MLKQMKYVGDKQSIYECDMCGKELKLNETNKYHRRKGRKSQKAFDLCDICNEKLVKSVMNYAKKHKKEE